MVGGGRGDRRFTLARQGENIQCRGGVAVGKSA